MADYRSTRDQVERLVRIAYAVADIGRDDLSEEILLAAHDIRGKSLRGSVPSNNVMASLANLMADLGIQFAVIGGIALMVHGQTRDTEDIDVLVDRMPGSDKTGDSSFMDRFSFYKKKSTTGTMLTLDHKNGGGVELLLANDPVRQWAVSTAVNTMVLGSTVPVVSAAALVALKIVAMVNNPDRAPKDKADIVSVLTTSKPDLTGVWPLLTDEEAAALEALAQAV